jgi:glycopeptide antibiotics resistance protein
MMKCGKPKFDAAKIIFILYGLILIWIVLFKTAISLQDVLQLRCTRSVNLIPFFYASDVGRLQMREVVLNVLIFVPLGIYSVMLGASWRRAILGGLGFSLFFELCQFAFAIGAWDVTDVMANTFGTLVGIVLYVLAGKIFGGKQKADKIINGVTIAFSCIFFAIAILLFAANRVELF